MSKSVLVPIAEGFEEIEALTIVDILRRADAHVVLAAVGDSTTVVGRSRIVVTADMKIEEALKRSPYDLLVLPGGLPNAHILRDSPVVQKAIREHRESRALLGAICAAPLALASAGVLSGIEATSHPGVREEMPGDGYSEKRVVDSDGVVTSRAPGTAMEFAFTLVARLFGEEKVKEVNQGVLASL